MSADSSGSPAPFLAQDPDFEASGQNAGPESIAWIHRLGSADVKFSPGVGEMSRVKASYETWTQILRRGGPQVYGVHTGYGADVSSVKEPARWHENQSELLDYLRVGVGDPFLPSVVRRALRLQAWKTAQGYSGIHPDTYLALCELSNQEALPKVPKHGSLGASGDLVPMAHAIAPIFDGSGPRGPRDVIGLVNTNSMMASFAVELHSACSRVVNEAIAATANAALALGEIREPFEPAGHAVNPAKPHVQIAAAGVLAAQRSKRERRGWSAECATPRSFAVLQERYSIRCSPQVLGNCMWNLESASERIVCEALSIADNPIALGEHPWHGGHFYAAGIATASDLMADAVARACELLDRQCLILMDPVTSHGLPENLAFSGTGHTKGIHQLLSSLNQSIRAHAVPSRGLSFSCEGNNQDVVPAAMAALISLESMLQLAQHVVRASIFVSDRAAHLRWNGSVPPGLKLEDWNAPPSA